jgi:hypothetical protein
MNIVASPEDIGPKEENKAEQAKASGASGMAKVPHGPRR